MVRETDTQPDSNDCINSHRPDRSGVADTPHLHHQADGYEEHLVVGYAGRRRPFSDTGNYLRNRDTGDGSCGQRRADRNRTNPNPVPYRPHRDTPFNRPTRF